MSGNKMNWHRLNTRKKAEDTVKPAWHKATKDSCWPLIRDFFYAMLSSNKKGVFPDKRNSEIRSRTTQ